LKYAIIKIEKTGADTANVMYIINANYTAWMIFLHSNNKQQIDTAIRWMKKLMRKASNQPGMIDTYANLIYKSGNKKEAIALETKALRIAQEDAVKYKHAADDVYQKTLDKMASGKPTWQ
jgi:flagellar motor component MotA